MNCKYCSKLCKSNNSLRNHERLCKLNENRQITVSNFIQYNKLRKELGIKGQNQFTKAESLGISKPIVSKETRDKISKSSKGRQWTTEQRKRHSESMKLAVERHPDSYTKNNVVGRVKNVIYNGIKLKGSWELLVAKWLDENSILWKHEDIFFEYIWNDSIHKYYPDFYLPDLDLYLEVKGYKTERDSAKWNVVNNLKVISLKEIKEIKSNNFKLSFLDKKE